MRLRCLESGLRLQGIACLACIQKDRRVVHTFNQNRAAFVLAMEINWHAVEPLLAPQRTQERSVALRARSILLLDIRITDLKTSHISLLNGSGQGDLKLAG
ncbi:MAG: hypothetical protein KVP17_002017 [Porospora cf. gigantea B]|uniref:uncharacterized protein n=1 Tax=Porospora cf. gigantea B TaxID=2853592 RepID=UPI003571ECAF|nr:MAG: hypothetical protein KVP17_002017 [Porospora cf. gigantea B]